MQRSVIKRELVDLVTTVAVLLVGELVVQLSGWPRLYVYVVALVLGRSVIAAVRTQRRRTTSTAGKDASSR